MKLQKWKMDYRTGKFIGLLTPHLGEKALAWMWKMCNTAHVYLRKDRFVGMDSVTRLQIDICRKQGKNVWKLTGSLRDR